MRADGLGGTPAVRGGIIGQGSAIRASVVMRGRLSCEGSTCPLPCGVRELGIIFLFRLSPKWGVNPDNSESDSPGTAAEEGAPPCPRPPRTTSLSDIAQKQTILSASCTQSPLDDD